MLGTSLLMRTAPRDAQFLRVAEKKRDIKLEDLKNSTGWLLGKMFDYLQKEVDDTGRTKWDAILEESKG